MGMEGMGHEPQRREQTPAQEAFKRRAAVQGALMREAGVKEWFGSGPDDPHSFAARFSDFWEDPNNAEALAVDQNDPAQLKMLLEAVRSYGGKETLH